MADQCKPKPELAASRTLARWRGRLVTTENHVQEDPRSAGRFAAQSTRAGTGHSDEPTQAGAELLLVRTPVVETLSFAVSEHKHAEARNDALVYLETIRKSNEQPDLHIQTRLIEGDVAGAIVDTALSEQVDLIVMSTHGYSGLTRWVLGSVTEKVLRSAPCPVLAVRAARHPQKVLITLDGSPLSDRAIEPGLAVAQSLNAAVTLLRVVPSVSIDGKLDEHERGLSRRMQEDLIEEAKDYLRARSEAAARSGMSVKCEVRIGSPAELFWNTSKRMAQI